MIGVVLTLIETHCAVLENELYKMQLILWDAYIWESLRNVIVICVLHPTKLHEHTKDICNIYLKIYRK